MNVRDKKYYCKDCNAEIGFSSGQYGSGLCRSCSNKNRIHKFDCTCAMCNDRTGQNNPMFGKCHTTETKQKMSLSHMGKKNHFFGKTHTEEALRKIKLFLTGRHLSEETKIKMSEQRQRENNANWQGGISEIEYPIEFFRLRNKIRIRDNHECQLCHTKEKDLDRELDVHHINYNKADCREENLISLCHQCNAEVNADREYWYAYFTYIMENILAIVGLLQ